MRSKQSEKRRRRNVMTPVNPVVPSFFHRFPLLEGSDEPEPPETFLNTDFEFVPILNVDETSVTVEEMKKRALKQNANFGYRFGEWLLTHPNKIPNRGRFYHILLPRTVANPEWPVTACLSWNKRGEIELTGVALNDIVRINRFEGFIRPRKPA